MSSLLLGQQRASGAWISPDFGRNFEGRQDLGPDAENFYGRVNKNVSGSFPREEVLGLAFAGTGWLSERH